MRHLPIARVDRSLSTFRTPTHFTRTESHAHRKASSARRSHCSPIQRSWQTPLISLKQNQTHLQTVAICPSLTLLAQHTHTHADRRHLPIPHIETIHQSFSQIGQQTAEKNHILHSSSTPWWSIRSPPGGNGTHDLPNHPPKFQSNLPTDS